jgi:hypothetical protein
MSASQQQPSDPALIAQRPLPTQAYMPPSAIEWLLICFAQDQQLFREARELIAEHHFKQNETPLRVMYEALCISTDRYGGATYETLAAIVSDMLAQNQGLMLTDVQRQIIFRPDEHGLIYQICNPTGVETEATNRNFSRDLLKRFAHERTVVEPLRRVMNPGFNQGVPENLTDFLSLVTRQQARLATLNSIPEANLTPPIGSPIVSSNVFVKTGVSFIDSILGGQRMGDANGIIGPTGGGKTTLAIHMAVAGAKQSWADAQATNTEPGLVIFITAEEAAIKLRPRIWSAFFNIKRSKLDTMTSWNDLSQPGRLEPYELAMQAGQPNPLSEIERYELNAPILNQCLRVLDLSGSDEHPAAGFGFIDEITSYLARYQQPIRTVKIDYAGIFCERYMQAKGMDEKNYRYLLKTFGDRCRQEISARFNCTTWVLHQLKGAVGTAKPTKLMHHSEAGESADFANNLTVCMCLGTVDPFTGCRRLNPSKVRYLPGEKITPPTLRINDDFAIMEDVTRLFVPSDTGQFLTPQDSHAIRATEGLEQRVPTGGPRGLRDMNTPLDPSQSAEY